MGREWWDIDPDDPLSARGRAESRDTLGRDDWQVRTETRSGMWSDEAAFHLSARIEAREVDDLVFAGTFEKAIRRDLVRASK